MVVPTPEGSHDPAGLDPEGEVEVWAAGGIVQRAGVAGVEVLVVHRTRHRDWSLPKGKVDPGETLIAAARREILEETGFECELAEPVATVRYDDSLARSKAVVYFAGTVLGGEFVPNDEVDEIRWCTSREAVTLLTYPNDARLLAELSRSDRGSG